MDRSILLLSLTNQYINAARLLNVYENDDMDLFYQGLPATDPRRRRLIRNINATRQQMEWIRQEKQRLQTLLYGYFFPGFSVLTT